jgi:PAS domain S-box-containing protein
VTDALRQETALPSPAPPGHRETAAALLLVAASGLALVLAAPFARVQLPEIKAFLPAYQAALLITDLITAILLYNLFARARSAALLVLASGYLFDALILVPHTLTFPGVFADTGLLGAGPQTTAWLYYFWHGGFIAFLLGYIVLARRSPAAVRDSGRLVIGSVLSVTVLVAALTGLTTLGHDWLPVLIQGTDYGFRRWISPFICIVAAVGAAMLWPRRNRSLLDLWLLVVLCTWICGELINGVLGAHRFDLGWYGGRAFGVVAAGVLLVLLLTSVHAELHERLRDQSRLAVIVTSSDDAIVGMTLDGTVTSWNAAAERIFGYTAPEMIGQPVARIIPAELQGEEREILRRLARGERMKNFHTVRTGKNGRRIDISLTLSPVFDQSGAVVGVSKIARDITAEKRAETELQQVRADLARVARVTALGEMTAAIAHEVNQPLTAVVNSANAGLRWLSGEPPDLAAARRSIERAVSAGTRAAEVIKRVRALIDKAPAQRERFSINDAISEVLALIQGEIARHSVRLRTSFASDVPSVLADRIQVQQVVLNLILNAIDAMNGASGPRELSLATARREADDVEVTVGDSGIGIDEKSLEKLFEPFYTTKPQGMGIGLAVSRAIVQAHGGLLWAQANTPRGALFAFSLPGSDGPRS